MNNTIAMNLRFYVNDFDAKRDDATRDALVTRCALVAESTLSGMKELPLAERVKVRRTAQAIARAAKSLELVESLVDYDEATATDAEILESHKLWETATKAFHLV